MTIRKRMFYNKTEFAIKKLIIFFIKISTVLFANFGLCRLFEKNHPV